MCQPVSFARLWRPGPWPHHGEGLSFLPPKPWRPAMSRKLVPLSSLIRTAANPRRNADRSPIEGLAESIRTDGILQNLVVEPAGDGLYRVIAGTRRLRALMHLRDRGDIDDARSEEHTSELQSLMRISYAVFCLKKKQETT